MSFTSLHLVNVKCGKGLKKSENFYLSEGLGARRMLRFTDWK